MGSHQEKHNTKKKLRLLCKFKCLPSSWIRVSIGLESPSFPDIGDPLTNKICKYHVISYKRVLLSFQSFSSICSFLKVTSLK